MDQGAPGARREVDLEVPVTTVSGVGPRLAERLSRLGLRTVRDLLEHIPRSYLDWREAASFGDLAAGEEATVRCTLERIRVRPTRRRRLKVVEGVVVDSAGVRETAIWFNQEYLAKLPPGTELLLHGTKELGGTFRVARHEVGDAGIHTVGLVPEYRASEEVASQRLRALVEEALPLVRRVSDPLPPALRVAEELPVLADALTAAHRPARREDADLARRRLAFQELVVFQLGLLRRRRELEAGTAAPDLGDEGDLVQRYYGALPFELTPEQQRAVDDIRRDVAVTRPMQRLLQGEVGSGKTVVALYALLRAVERRHQGALMAPTETLAEQHFLTLEPICGELGVRLSLRTRTVRDELEDVDIVVGTHALIQEDVGFRSLAVAVIDEQHRFGVEQRRALGATTPHTLHMTATPIPRTLAQAVYGELDVTEIARPPKGRKPVVTRWVTHERSAEAYKRLCRHLEQGRQAYVVCPLVTESETVEARAAEQEAERLQRAELRGFRVGCLHGKLRPVDRRAVMDDFKQRQLDVLVATTVIEVGVDVPNATIMIVQEADRFGLAQLHQLRGRVGRGAEQSYCLLVSRPKEELTDAARQRLQALVDISDGFELAEVDLDLRGEGELLGTRQSGLPDLRFASLRRDRRLTAKARRWAEELLDEEGPLDAEVERLFADEDHRGFA